MAGKSGDWSDPSSVITANNNSAVKTQWAGDIGKGKSTSAYMILDAYVYSTMATETTGNSTVQVPKDSVKFSFEIGGWSWDSKDGKPELHTLRLSLSVTPKLGDDKEGAKQKKSSKEESTTKSH